MSNENRFDDFARISADWFWETDTDDRFRYFSVAVTRTGLALVGRLGARRRDGATQQPDNLARIATLEAVVARRDPFRDFVFRAGNPGEQSRWCSISGEPRHDAAGKFLGYRGAGRDVTEQVEAQRKFETAEPGAAGDPSGDARWRAAVGPIRHHPCRQRPALRNPGHPDLQFDAGCQRDLPVDARPRHARRIRRGGSGDAGARTSTRHAQAGRRATQCDIPTSAHDRPLDRGAGCAPSTMAPTCRFTATSPMPRRTKPSWSGNRR